MGFQVGGDAIPHDANPAGQGPAAQFGWYDYLRPADKDDIYYVEEKHRKKLFR